VPYAPHVQVRCNGTLGDPAAPVEIFSYGFCLPGGTLPEAGTERPALVTAIQDFHGSPDSKIATEATLREIAFSVQVPDGVYPPGHKSAGKPKQKQSGDTVRVQVTKNGGGGSGIYPFQVAYRVSLDDGVRGRSHRGGFYVPCPTIPVDTLTGLLNSSQVQTAAARVKTMFAAIEATGRGPVILASSVIGNVTVTRIRVGRVADTMRTRRNKVGEHYFVAA
jgi:dienelactone hydrolase